MKKIWTKALAYVMAVTMCFSAVNVPAYAQEGTVTEASTEAVTTNEAVTEEATVCRISNRGCCGYRGNNNRWK